MEEKILKLKEYLHMDSLLPFAEYKEFYTEVIEELNKNYSELDQKARLQARYICNTIKVNAESRARGNKINGKAFKKMAAKCAFWVEAIDHRLGKEGLDLKEINRLMEEINKTMEVEE
ncbi:MAG: hypothetical protein ACOX7U_08020 [Desulfitobacteriia bacterium]|jgi:hypothetical protein